MPDRRDANGAALIRELIDDSIRPGPQRAKPAKAAPQRMAGLRLALEQSKRLIHGVDQRPFELEQIALRAAREDDLGHPISAVGGARRAPLGAPRY